MEFWLIQGEEAVRLPVLPSEFKIKKSNNNSTVVVENIGEVSLMGKPKLAEISLSSFFPAQKYSFCKKEPSKPYNYVKIIEKWRLSGEPIRLIITRTDVNGLFTIEEFEYGEQDGTRDVYYTLSLKEYRMIEEKIL